MRLSHCVDSLAALFIMQRDEQQQTPFVCNQIVQLSFKTFEWTVNTCSYSICQLFFVVVRCCSLPFFYCSFCIYCLLQALVHLPRSFLNYRTIAINEGIYYNNHCRNTPKNSIIYNTRTPTPSCHAWEFNFCAVLPACLSMMYMCVLYYFFSSIFPTFAFQIHIYFLNSYHIIIMIAWYAAHICVYLYMYTVRRYRTIAWCMHKHR